MYEIEVDISPASDILSDLRQKVLAIRAPVFAALQGPIAQQALDTVHDTIALPPGEVVHPFLFMTPKSRAFYFALKRGKASVGPMPGQDWSPDGGAYNRLGTVEEAWDVSVDVRSNDGLMTLTNTATDWKGDMYAASLYSDDPVPGHAVTGWYLDDREVEAIADEVEAGLLDAFDQAFAEYRS